MTSASLPTYLPVYSSMHGFLNEAYCSFFSKEVRGQERSFKNVWNEKFFLKKNLIECISQSRNQLRRKYFFKTHVKILLSESIISCAKQKYSFQA